MNDQTNSAQTGAAARVAYRHPPLADLTLDAEGIRRYLEDPAFDRDFRGVRLTGAILSGVDLSHCHFESDSAHAVPGDLHAYRTVAIGTVFNKCDLTGANFRCADLRQANLEGTLLQGATFAQADMRGAFVGSVMVEDGEFAGAQLNEVDLSDAVLPRANLSGADLSDADLGGADLRGADLYDSVLSGTFLGQALMNDANLCDAHGNQPLLAGAVLTRAKMSGANLPGIILRKAVLNHAHLDHSQLPKADLSDVSALGASLRRVVLTDANCCNVDFSDANLHGAVLRRADLRSARFNSDTVLTSAVFADAILHGVRWRGVDVSATDLKNVSCIGDERLAGSAPLAQRASYFRFASEAYGGVSSAMQSSSLSRASISFHFRAAVMDRRAALNDLITSLLFILPQEPSEKQVEMQIAILHSSGVPVSRASSPYQLEEQSPKRLSRLFSIGTRVIRFLASPVYLLRWFGAFLLGLIAGYGDRPWRALVSYFFVLTSFAVGDFIAGYVSGQPLTVLASIVLSVTSFHGRGFNNTDLTLGSLLATLSAIEASIGAFIELLFVAAFTRRFIGTRG